jgi:hypothetical protein
MEELRALVSGREVTVQTLRVDGKKMTLQFFKQLPKRDFFIEGATPDPALKPWGRVHYLLQDGGDSWLVAEVDGQLYRCATAKPRMAAWSLNHHEKELARLRAEIEKHKGTSYGDIVERNSKASIERHMAEAAEAATRIKMENAQNAELLKLDALPQLFIAA